MSRRETEVRETLVYQLSAAQDPLVRNKGGRPRTRPHHIKVAPPAPPAQASSLSASSLSAAAPPVPGTVRYLGLDVHAETITVAIADADGSTPRLYGQIPATPETIRKLVHKLGRSAGYHLAAVYEAGPTGYWLWRFLTALDVHCIVVAPNRVPQQPGDRVKTDKRDALKLVRLHRSGDLDPITVPDAAHEALRDLVRAREQALYARTHARHQLTSFLLRRGVRRPHGMTPWATRHRRWLTEHVVHSPEFQPAPLALTLAEYLHEVDHHDERLARYTAALAPASQDLAPHRRAVVHALQALKGVSLLTAVTIVSELGELSRFRRPALLMGYTGLVPKEDSTGQSIRKGGLTKTGNAHLRRIVVEAAWSYRSPAKLTPAIKARHAGQSEAVKRIAWAAQIRLHDRYKVLASRRKPMPQVIAALARELLGFIWAIGVEVERPLLTRGDPAPRAEIRPEVAA